MNEDVIIPCNGGSIVLAAATTFQGSDRMTGATQEVSLPDRVMVIHGRKKSTLDGTQCKFIAIVFKENKEFREWCEKC